MFSAGEITGVLDRLGVTHVVWVPDTYFGQWEHALESAATIQLVRVCREGEAWPLAAGLQLGGQVPLVVMQTTGLFESGDALRNVLFDLRIPLFALIGARNWLVPDSPDSARRFAEPVIRAWGLNYVVIESPDDKSAFAEHCSFCRQTGSAGAVIVAEGGG